MADRKISQLAQLQTAEDQDYLPIVDNSEGETKRILVGNLLTDQLTPAERTKLQGIAEGATANQTDAHLLNRANHTGPTGLGTSATRDAPDLGNADSDEVVLGSDTRLTNARTPTAHNHTASEITDFNSSVDSRISGSSDAGHGTGSVTLHNDVTSAGSGAIITANERSAISNLGTASTKNVGTSANQVVQLDAQSKLPAVDGSQLTNIALVLSQ